ncbi:MAG TPA: cyclic nucleotide-binding domain-containing protein, partial [bacterium]|nr:cyclic nucleotide-binding domain-containing protein [bacterium]
GYGVLHILSKEPATAAIPFIFLTAKAEKSEFRKGMELGADDYVTKPFDETELLNAIEARFKKSELLKAQFTPDLAGLNRFLDAAQEMTQLEGLFRQRPTVKLKKKDILFQEGDTPNAVYFVSRGKIKVFRIHDDGKEFVTGVYGSGDFLGYVPLLQASDQIESAAAMEESEVCKIPKDDFLALVYKNRDVAARFLRLLAKGAVEQERQLLSLAYDTVKRRVAQALIRLGTRRISIQRDDLAGMAGTATETVIRCLSDLREEGLIQIEGRDILILDQAGLEEAG